MQFRFLLSFILLAAAASSTFLPLPNAEKFESRHVSDLALNPADLQFRLTTAGGQRRFHIGQRIPLVLEFSSSSSDKYKLNGATYDRSGRLPTEEFVAGREDIIDPLLDYFGTYVIGGIAGGIRSNPVLESEPYRIELDLNDWFRFDRPGRYCFYLKSHRLSRERAPGESGERTIAFAAVSNILEIEILQDNAEWQAVKLNEIREILSQPEPELPKPGGPPVPYNPLSDKMDLARRELRYLATPTAVDFSFELARINGSSPHTLLLVGARNRPHMIAALEAYLADPRVEINQWDIRVRALFTLLQKESPKALPIFIWQFADRSEQERLRREIEARQNRFEAILRAEAIRLIPLVASKNPAARKSSGEAIAAIAPEAARAAQIVPPDDYGLSRQELISGFGDFPPEQQSELLGRKWDLLRGPEMIPVLNSVIAKAKPQPVPEGSAPLNVWGVDGGVAEAALRRLTELSPQTAAAVIKADLASTTPRFARFAVREFPTQDIPEADGALRAQLTTNLHTALPLIARFATVRLAGELRRFLTASWPCLEEQELVTYFVRTMPQEDGEGRQVLSRAMSNRKDRGCYRFLLHSVASVVWNPAIEAQAIATLNDPDPEAALSASRVLATHGGSNVEPLLWKRLEQWAGQWRGRSAELERRSIRDTLPNPEARLGDGLFTAIASAQSWLLDEPRRRRLLALCVEDPCREQFGRPRSPGPIAVEASNAGSAYPAAFRVDGVSLPTFDALKRKLQQFPAGTQFLWCARGEDPFDILSPGQRDEMFNELARFLSGHSMSIARRSSE